MCLLPPAHSTIWIIIAKVSPYSKKAHLVNVRWPCDLDVGSLEAKKLFSDAIKLLRNDGMETTRTGGSNGLPNFSTYNILRLLKSETAFVRKGKGVKVVKGKKKWHCFYISSGGKSKSTHMLHRAVAKWDAVQPQLGGQFNVTTSFFKAHGDIIKNMTVAKYNTALLIPQVGKELSIVIQDGAIDSTMQDINLTTTMLKHQEENNKSNKFIELLSSWNKFSVVAYPVSYHFDVFIGGCMSLENKICFHMTLIKMKITLVGVERDHLNLFLLYLIIVIQDINVVDPNMLLLEAH